jgi:hypothetical protein
MISSWIDQWCWWLGCTSHHHGTGNTELLPLSHGKYHFWLFTHYILLFDLFKKYNKINILWFKISTDKTNYKKNNICKKMNKINNQTWCLKIKMWHFQWNHGVNIRDIPKEKDNWHLPVLGRWSIIARKAAQEQKCTVYWYSYYIVAKQIKEMPLCI